MKVLLLTHHWKPYTHHSEFSGYERIAHYLESSHEVDILTWKTLGFKYNDPPNVYRVFTPPTDIILERRLIMSLNAFCHCRRYDVVHALYSVPGLFPSLKYPTVATIHLTSDLNTKNLWLRYKTLIQRAIFKRAKYLITVSSNLKDILEKKYHLDNVAYIPHGIDTNYFASVAKNSIFKERLLGDDYSHFSLTTGINGTDRDFLFKIAESFPMTLFGILGKIVSPHPRNLRFFSGISDNDLKSLYEASDLFLKPLTFASANNSILEAMSMGKPIITDAIPGVMDYLDDNTAFLVRKRKDFISVLEDVLNNKKYRDLKGINARKKAEREFDWSVIAKKTSEIYDLVRK